MQPGPAPPYDPSPRYDPAPPQQPQQPYGAPPPGYVAPMPPPKQGMSTGAIIAIVVVVVVAVIILIPALLYMAVVSPVVTNPGPPPKPTLTMAIGQWSGLQTTVSIIAVSTSTLDSAILTYQVISPNGTAYFGGPAGSGHPVNGVVVTITYNDGGGEGRVGADDNIVISVGQSSDLNQLHGTTFRVLFGTDVIGTAVIP